MSYRIINKRPGPVVLALSNMVLPLGGSLTVEELDDGLLLAADKGLVQIEDLSPKEDIPKLPPLEVIPERPSLEVVPEPPPVDTKDEIPPPDEEIESPQEEEDIPDPAPVEAPSQGLSLVDMNVSDAVTYIGMIQRKPVLEELLRVEERKGVTRAIHKRLKELGGKKK